MAGNDDMRYYETFFAYHLNDWMETYGSFVNHHKFLTGEYESEGCSTLDASSCSETYEFLYPEHIKKVYFIEGVIKGQITIVATSASVTVNEYRVTVCKVDDAGLKTELFTTGWITTGTYLEWDAEYDVGDEIVYPFRINAWDKAKLFDHERIFLRVQVDADSADAYLWHSNDATWEDIKITIPFKM